MLGCKFWAEAVSVALCFMRLYAASPSKKKIHSDGIYILIYGSFQPRSSSVKTPSSVDPTMNLQSQRFFFAFPLSSRCHFQPWFGSRIPARPSMKSPHFDLPLYLLLNRRRFCRHPSATTSSTEAVDVVPALGRPPHLLPGSRSRFRLPSALPSPL
jgi:hypothetical protein